MLYRSFASKVASWNRFASDFSKDCLISHGYRQANQLENYYRKNGLCYLAFVKIVEDIKILLFFYTLIKADIKKYQQPVLQFCEIVVEAL